jgi:hypothetical protein
VSCNDFQANLDLYVDGELSSTDMRSAAAHAAMCTSCDSLVTSNQQLHVLLTTAVTDRVTAVDVSGLWESIEVELDNGPGVDFSKPAVLPTKKPSFRHRFGEWLGTLAGDGFFIPIRAGALAAAAVAVALIVALPATETEAPRVGPRSAATNSAIGSSTSVIMAAAAKVRVRPVSIDSMEVAEGRNVTTWMRPKTKTRVIWVGDSNAAEGFGVNNLSLER